MAARLTEDPNISVLVLEAGVAYVYNNRPERLLTVNQVTTISSLLRESLFLAPLLRQTLFTTGITLWSLKPGSMVAALDIQEVASWEVRVPLVCIQNFTRPHALY